MIDFWRFFSSRIESVVDVVLLFYKREVLLQWGFRAQALSSLGKNPFLSEMLMKFLFELSRR